MVTPLAVETMKQYGYQSIQYSHRESEAFRRTQRLCFEENPICWSHYSNH